MKPMMSQSFLEPLLSPDTRGRVQRREAARAQREKPRAGSPHQDELGARPLQQDLARVLAQVLVQGADDRGHAGRGRVEARRVRHIRT